MNNLIPRRDATVLHALLLVLLLSCGTAVASSATDRPNILWLTSEDHGPHMGCYGDEVARTPNIDALARKGMVFTRVWAVHPVCAPARTAIISGMYGHSTGALHMRSMVPMPEGTRMFPELLREAGYYCANYEKEDYNLPKTEGTWDDSSANAHWRNRRDGQPFFAVFNSMKSHESQIRVRPHTLKTDPAAVRVPAYHPDLPEVRQDWAQYYDKVSEADADAGTRLRELEEAGLADDTIVFFFADHGSGMPRSKRWPSHSGLHVPLVVYFPPKWAHLAPEEYRPGGKSDRLVSFVDLAPTVLSLAGLQPPEWMQGAAFAGRHAGERSQYLFGSRGRMDERADEVRSVTDGRYVYLRNFNLHVPQGPYIAYQFETPTTRVWWDAFQAGQTDAAQSIFWQVPKAPEELYDLSSDPDEVHNLADSPEHQAVKERLRGAVYAHLERVRDVCLLPEGEMFERSQGRSPYDMMRAEGALQWDRIFTAADVAARLELSDVGQLEQWLSDEDSVVRYWAALGLLMRGEELVAQTVTRLRAALEDRSPYVRIVAARALAAHGDAEASAAALEVLRSHANPAGRSVFEVLPALVAIDELGPRAGLLRASVRGFSGEPQLPHPRYGSYVPNLIKRITEGTTP